MSLRDEYAGLSDQELVDRFRSGEQRVSFTMLVERYQKRIYFAARKMVNGNHDEADEIAQETFVKAYEALGSFRGESQFYTWIYRIMMNAVIYRQRKRKAHTMVEIDDVASELVSDDASPHDGIERQEITSLIEAAIATLPPKQREVFLMRFYDEMPYEDIASILGTSVGGLKANYFHAAKKVTEYVQRAGELSVATTATKGRA
ncbi:MAG: sigma-70 family RNA polymerase sigma factor [Bacteroidetes bacterium]|nr:sigma-70 family RNA polymerase sigma factor [Bacteroidota bacterium]